MRDTTIYDLSHPIAESMPLWPDDPKTTIKTHATVAHDGYMLNRVTIGEHTGTHIGAPRHFSPTGQSVDQIPPQHLCAPAAVIDVQKQAENDCDYLVKTRDILEWENKYGQMNKASVVLIKTGWSRLWSNPDAYWGTAANGKHFPGVSVEAAHFMVEHRNIVGLGIDTGGIDGGQSDDFAANRLLAGNNVYHLENLNLLTVKSARLLVIVGALGIEGGSGSPCRVFAFAEQNHTLERKLFCSEE